CSAWLASIRGSFWNAGSRPTYQARRDRSIPRRFLGIVELGELGFLRCERHLLLVLAEFLVPGGDRVRPGRDVVDHERPSRPGDREVRMVEDREPGLHPGVDVAPDADGDLRVLERDRSRASFHAPEIPRARVR